MRAGRRIAALFGVLATLALGAGPAYAAVSHPLLGSISGEKIGVGQQFKDACGIALDGHGDIYIADHYQNRIAIFDAQEEFLTQITGIEPLDAGGVTSVDGPCGIAVDSTGRVYVNDYHRDVQRFDPTVFPPTTGTAYSGPTAIDSDHQATGVAVDSADRIYVDDRTYVAVYEPSGEPVMDGVEPLRIGAGGAIGNGYGVAVSGFPGTAGRVYVADAADGVVKAFDPTVDPSMPAEVIDGSGGPGGGFVSLVDSDLAVDPGDGHLYVADNLQPNFEKPKAIVVEFSPQGNFRDLVPHPRAEGEASFLVDAEPTALAVNGSGDVYVTSGNFEEALAFVFGPGDAAPTHALSVSSSGAGSGTIVSSPPGLHCGTACTGEFDEGSNVTVTATPTRGSRFAGWTGCTGPSIANTCTVAMGTDHTVIADFERASQLTLTVMVGGTGRGAIVSAPAGIDCGAICSAEFDEGSLVTLAASAAGGSRFAGWSGCASVPSPDSCRVTVGADSSVGATFIAEPVGPPPPQPQPESRTLTVAMTGLGGATGKITSSPGGIDCGATCSHAYDRGAAVTLAAQPAPGSVFLGWGGCEVPAGSSCTQHLGSDRVIVASFGPAPISGLHVRKVAVRGKWATLTIVVPGPGELSGSGKWLRPASVLPLAGGDRVLHLRLSHAGEKAVAKSRRRLAVRASVSFVSLQGGEGVRVAQTLNFRRKVR